MQDILQAYGRALRSLMRPDIFWHLMWPTLLAVLLWVGLVITFGSDLAAQLLRLLESWPLIGGWLAPEHETLRAAVSLAANLVLWLLALPLIYVTAALIVSVFAISFMLDRVGERDYADLALRRGGSFAGSLINSLGALLVFLLLALLSLPLWFVPGLGLVLSILLAVWLNKRCYSYDALMNHADAQELLLLPRQQRGRLWLLGLGAALLGFVPLLNLFVPALTGLAFVHYLLEALRRQRALGGAALS